MTEINSVPLIHEKFQPPEKVMELEAVEAADTKEVLPDLQIYKHKVITTNEHHVLISQFKDDYGEIIETFPSPLELKRYAAMMEQKLES